MKKTIAFFLMFTFLLGMFAGCGLLGKEPNPASTTAAYTWTIKPTLQYDMLSSLFEVPEEKHFHYLNATSDKGNTVLVFETGEEIYPPSKEFSLFICFLGHIHIQAIGAYPSEDVIAKIAKEMGYEANEGHGGGFEGNGEEYFISDKENGTFGFYMEFHESELDPNKVAKQAFPYYKIDRYYTGVVDEKSILNSKSTQFGFATAEGEILTPLIYDSYNRRRNNGNGTVQVEADGKYGYFSLYDGKIVADCLYDPLYPIPEERYYENNLGFFNEGLCPVNKDGKYGYIDLEGNEVVPLEFEGATHVLNGKAWVKQGGLWGQIEILAASKSANTEQETRFSIQDALPADVIPFKDMKYFTVNADGGLRLREKAGVTQKEILLIPNEDYVQVYGETTVEEKGVSEKWYYAEYQGQVGYISAEYVIEG